MSLLKEIAFNCEYEYEQSMTGKGRIKKAKTRRRFNAPSMVEFDPDKLHKTQKELISILNGMKNYYFQNITFLMLLALFILLDLKMLLY